jgi:hypothetical protein
MDGVPIASTFFDAKARPVRERQYFEIFTNRAIYDNGWIACAQHTLPWRQDYAPGNWDKDKWELYHIDEDFSEAKNLAAVQPEKLAELKKLFDEEATKFHVNPFDDRGSARLAVPKPRREAPIRAGHTSPTTADAPDWRKPRRRTPKTGHTASPRISRCRRRVAKA